MRISLIKLLVISLFVSFGLSACAPKPIISQTVEIAQLGEDLGQEIIIIPEAQGVRDNFKKAYSAALEGKGFSVVEKPFGTPLADYPLSSTYIARWSWDLATYMSYAEIHILAYGKEIGHALYDSRLGRGSTKKFINAEEKINELIEQLFPDGATVVHSGGNSEASEKPNAD